MSDPTLQPLAAATHDGGGEVPKTPLVPWNVTDAIVVLVLWLIAIIFIGGAVLFALTQAFPQAQSEALSLPITAFILIVICVGYVRVRYGKAATRLLRGTHTPTLRDFGIGVAAGAAALAILAFGVGQLLEWLARAMQTELPEVQETFKELAADPTAAPWLVAGSVLVAPVAEELFYRGMLFPALRKRLPLWPAMGISAVLFGLSHLQTTLEGYLLVLLIIIPFGMFLAYVYERRGTLLVPILTHSIFNLVQVIELIRQGSG